MKETFTSSFSLKIHMFIRHLTNTVTDAQLIQAATLELGEWGSADLFLPFIRIKYRTHFKKYFNGSRMLID